MCKYIQITRSDVDGSYIMPLREGASIVDAELDDAEYLEPGVSITLTIVKMSELEYDNLPEFMGW